MTYWEKAARILAWTGFVIGASAVCLQFTQTIPSSMAAGRSLPLSILFFFAFFTILTNIAAALCLAGQVLPLKALAFFRDRRNSGGVASAMTVVLITYHFMLSHLYAFEGLNLLCDRLMHYVMPTITILWWLASATGETAWKRALVWLIYPLVYVVLVYVRWTFVGEVPYPFLDPAMGAQKLAVSIAGMLTLFVVAAFATVAADKAMARVKRV
jgi:hypothetical protein